MIEIDIPNHGETHYLKTHYGEVETILNDIGETRGGADLTNDLTGMLEAPKGVEGVREGTGITPDLSRTINDDIQKSNFPFTLEDDLKETFSDDDGAGSHNSTTVFERSDMVLRDAFEMLDLTGQLDGALTLIEKRRSETDPANADILAYVLATYSKGWRAEAILNADPRWRTGNVAEDEGGIDLYRTKDNTPLQLKPLTPLASKGPAYFKNRKTDHIFYMWRSDGTLAICEADEWTDVKNAEADRNGFDGQATLLAKSEKLADSELGRGHRYLWW